MAWAHADVYNAVNTHSLRHLDMPPAKIAWHLIWLWHEEMIAFRGDWVIPIREAQEGDTFPPRRLGKAA